MQGAPSSPARKSRFGRLFVQLVFWIVTGYGVVAVLGSIVTDLYGKPPATGSSQAAFAAKQRTWCLRTLIALRDELDSELRYELGRPSNKPTRWADFSKGWQASLDNATTRCSGADPLLTEAYSDLRAAYGSYQRGLGEVEQGRLQLYDQLAHNLELLLRKHGSTH